MNLSLILDFGVLATLIKIWEKLQDYFRFFLF